MKEVSWRSRLLFVLFGAADKLCPTTYRLSSLHSLLKQLGASLLGFLRRLLLLLQIFAEQVHDLVLPHLLRPGDHAPVSAHLEML